MTQAAILAASGSPGTTTGFKNRIINGNMVIDQRNAGSAVTPANFAYTLDRWAALLTQSSKFTVQQVALGGALPSFPYAMKIVSSSAYSVASGDRFAMYQAIEGFNANDLNWGTANAKSVTLSFQVYSSLTGTFSGAIRTGGGTDYSYVFTYSIPVAATWTTISVTVPGPTVGTWANDNSAWGYVAFSLGVGSTYSATAGSWTAGNFWGNSSAVNVVGTSGATFYLTGVQLEVGTTATNFDFRSIGTELSLCQRYYEKSYAYGTAPGTNTQTGIIWSSQMQALTTSYIGMSYTWKVQKRATPTIVAYDKVGTAGVLTRWTLGGSEFDNSNYTIGDSCDSTWVFYSSGSSNSAGIKLQFTASAEL